MRNFARTSLRLRLRSAEMINDIIDDLNNQGKNATGTLAKSVKFSMAKTGGLISVDFKAKDYWKWVDKGRKPGKNPPVKPLIRWAKSKLGLSGEDAKQAAFAISRFIGKNGTKGTNIFTNNINKFKKDAQKLQGKELKADLTEFITKAFK
jgi:hypothetical protein